MNFLKPTLKTITSSDPVFGTIAKYQEALKQYPKKDLVNATLGALFDDDGNLITMETFYQVYKSLPNQIHASYAKELAGNRDFLETIENWYFQDNHLTLPYKTLATPGGSGALSAALQTLVPEGSSVLIPDIGWSSYELMLTIRNLQPVKYRLFDDQLNFNLQGIKTLCQQIANSQQRLFIIINDPCHNPTGYSMTTEQWESLISFFNELPSDYPIVILNDIAYIDYALNPKQARRYFDSFNQINPNLLVLIACSLSKSLTVYGQRLGAIIALAANHHDLENVYTALSNHARGNWSNANNPTMVAFVQMLKQYQDQYMAEKQQTIDLLNQRSSLFINEASEVDLPLYPYQEGFFITVAIDPLKRDQYHQALLEHHIFTVPVDAGIRLAICGIPTYQLTGLAKKMKQVLDTIN